MFDPSLGIDLEQLRERLKRFSDQELVRFGKAARYMYSPQAQPFGGKHPPAQAFVVQLKEAREEWAHRRKAEEAPKFF
jgi:hypothetical protein